MCVSVWLKQGRKASLNTKGVCMCCTSKNAHVTQKEKIIGLHINDVSGTHPPSTRNMALYRWVRVVFLLHMYKHTVPLEI